MVGGCRRSWEGEEAHAEAEGDMFAASMAFATTEVDEGALRFEAGRLFPDALVADAVENGGSCDMLLGGIGEIMVVAVFPEEHLGEMTGEAEAARDLIMCMPCRRAASCSDVWG